VYSTGEATITFEKLKDGPPCGLPCPDSGSGAPALVGGSLSSGYLVLTFRDADYPPGYSMDLYGPFDLGTNTVVGGSSELVEGSVVVRMYTDNVAYVDLVQPSGTCTVSFGQLDQGGARGHVDCPSVKSQGMVYAFSATFSALP
jgi:hypothetical protein